MAQLQILLVDDEQEILEPAASVLEQAGYQVARAMNADIALLLMDQRIPFDVMVTDVVLPGYLDGFGLVQKARELIPNIEINYSTGFGDVARVRSRGALYGEVLRKPWGADDLLRAVHNALRHRVPN